MTRWKNRTEEEKKQILIDRDERQAPREVREKRKREKESDLAMELMRNHYIPIRCPDCKTWVGSHQYVMYYDDMPSLKAIGGSKEASWIRGACKECGHVPITRLVDVRVLGPNEGMVIAQLMILLQSEGRLNDKRRKTHD